VRAHLELLARGLADGGRGAVVTEIVGSEMVTPPHRRSASAQAYDHRLSIGRSMIVETVRLRRAAVGSVLLPTIINRWTSCASPHVDKTSPRAVRDVAATSACSTSSPHTPDGRLVDEARSARRRRREIKL